MSENNVGKNNEVTSKTSVVWDNHISVPDTLNGFTLRTTFPTDLVGVEVKLEKWKAGVKEPPHSHLGDDMTVVIEGRMSIQFIANRSTGLIPDEDRIFLSKGQTGYIKDGRIHDTKCIEEGKLVYVHDRSFEFIELN